MFLIVQVVLMLLIHQLSLPVFSFTMISGRLALYRFFKFDFAFHFTFQTGLTPLMEAASGGYVDVGRVLIDRGADVNAQPVPSSRDTALTIAADKGHYKFVELLVLVGAQVDVKNKKGCTPLWLGANGRGFKNPMLFFGYSCRHLHMVYFVEEMFLHYCFDTSNLAENL